MPLRAAALTTLCVLACAGAMAQATGTPPERQRELVRMVRQDCGSCHGMHLTGGLGPPLTTAALAEKPVPSMAATIFHGRPGTPMPPWRAFVTEAEALWIAEQLVSGFPPWPPRPQP
ncbi:cytochrome c [Acidovorax sp. ACV01]|uniref:c-type cytochrome n=1 Tax=Acidovorax sp. ACV01 TaxID=2769311 RepID=UPI00178280E1|nr:cytochrome c [Acidovorax sp. ACV01]MBD9390901.1 cytochrome c [Acidovorax sp. ACV01]